MDTSTKTKKKEFVADLTAALKLEQSAKQVAAHIRLLASYEGSTAPSLYQSEVKKSLAELKQALAVISPTNEKEKREQSPELLESRAAWGKRLYQMKLINDDPNKDDATKAVEKAAILAGQQAEFPSWGKSRTAPEQTQAATPAKKTKGK